MNPRFHQFQQQIANPWKFRWFLLMKLPSALFSGLRLQEMHTHTASICVRYGWRNQNPFRSMYFAVQAMAAEMSTGLLASAQVYQRTPAVSMLVLDIKGTFLKKATGSIVFSCEEGGQIAAAVEETIQTNEPRTITCRSVGKNENGDVVSEFLITWSFKARPHSVLK
jgi:hypothetical protein